MVNPRPPLILYVVNSSDFFVSHRLPVAKAAKESGFEVHVATAAGNGVEAILDCGFFWHEVPFSRSGQSPLIELKTVIWLYRLFVTLMPSLIHLVTIKPVIYGGVTARLARVPSVVSAISGLGTVFLATSLSANFRRRLILALYRLALKRDGGLVVFQNPDDRALLLSANAIDHQQARMIKGSGVILSDYPYLPEPANKSTVVMAARLLKDKGVLDYLEAAKILNGRGVKAEFLLVGDIDPGNPSSLSSMELEQIEIDGYVTLLGHCDDIAAVYSAANVVCLPSYREGLPKSLVEAAACGRAVVTTDVPGCRDAIIPNKTGVLVPVQDARALANAIAGLLCNKVLRHEMGRAGRELAEREFDVDMVANQHLDIYQELLQRD